MDFSRLLSELLIPARRGIPLTYRPYDCHAGCLTESTRLPVYPLTVVEGSYSTHPSLVGQYDIKVFLTCSRQEQKHRLNAREGSSFPAFQHQWIPFEERYLQACETVLHSDFVIDTSNFLP